MPMPRTPPSSRRPARN